ncbi:MAG: hypothetical protein MUP98_09215, partial [Candidatus Aminicenantes bacterium]|nr:hypothetical protein [Candidatus Aminicenantes bacterium]
MTRNYLLFKVLLISSLIVTWAGCSVHTQHTTASVSNAIKDRTGHGLNVDKIEQELNLPDDVALQDGLTEEEAVAIALWNNALFQTELVQ